MRIWRYYHQMDALQFILQIGMCTSTRSTHNTYKKSPVHTPRPSQTWASDKVLITYPTVMQKACICLNWATRVLMKDVAKNPTVTLTEGRT